MTDQLTFVIFGASGDLSRRKLIPALFNLYCKERLPVDLHILGLATRPWSSNDFRQLSYEGLTAFTNTQADASAWTPFSKRLEYLSGNFNDDATYRNLAAALDGLEATPGNRIYYLATPPEYFLEIITGLAAAGLLTENGGWRRVVIEKPFGFSLETARALNRSIHQMLREDQVFRIDHYLGKETVQNILVARFANAIFEPIWNRNYIDNVQITVAETVGVETRGKYYDHAGVIRDMFQNHLLQLLTLVAMEPTSSYKADALRDEKMKVISAIRPIDSSEVARYSVIGQYRGYQSESNVAPDSRTATYAAVKLFVDNWRWQGVPFYLRSGKKLAEKNSEIIIQFKSVPHRIFPMEGDFNASSNLLSLCLQPAEGIHLRFEAKVPGSIAETRSVTMDFDYKEEFGENSLPDAYERLLLDVTLGDTSLFTRADQTELSWQLIDPLLKGWENPQAQPPLVYEPGSWGPEESNHLLNIDHCQWHLPCGGRC